MNPAVLTLAPASSRSSDPPLSLDHLCPSATALLPPDERHLVADDDRGRHRLRLIAAHGEPLALTIPVDVALPIRLDAASRLTRCGVPSTGYRPTALQRGRLVLLLNILDAEVAGLSKREIAARLVYSTAPPLHGAAWKGSTERRRTHRLSVEAARVRDHGIIDLLHGRLHPPG